MKLLSQNINDCDGSGEVELFAETGEDLWHAYNLLSKGDLLTSVANRKIKDSSKNDIKKGIKQSLKEEDYDYVLKDKSAKRCKTGRLGSFRSGTRVKIKLTIEIESIYYDTEYYSLHVNGRCAEENGIVGMGQYHTLKLEPNKEFGIAGL